ncbi:electron transport complex subunit RsxC [Halomonas sp. Bachu 37]|uniref:electron transport complex subunit RsxC n=1 Tax=Halomonas kashgarensis TaxID=3084920 RepID=UPI003216DF39
MARAFDFPGGIYPPQRKTLSGTAALKSADLPQRVRLALRQHSGSPATPCVAVGDQVRTGERVAQRDGMISADLHASISGRIAAITETHVEIEGDGRDEWLTLPPLEWRTSPHDTLLERLDESGVVGLGGAGFPTQVKARVRQRHALDTLIVNAAECEPYITADDATLRNFATDVLEGAQLMAHLAGARRVIVGIEDNKPEAVTALRRVAAASGPVEVELKVVATRYPSGAERQLIKLLLNREVPSGGLPADVGVLCHNPGTLLAVLQAVRDGIPLVSRVVTLTGQVLARPGNVIARLGTPVSELLQAAGLDSAKLYRLVQGGPMMGSQISLEATIEKTSNCLIAATYEELPPAPEEQPCIRCGACESVCPAALLPQQLHWHARAAEDARLERYHLFDCIECGACSYVCPSHIPLVEDYREAKQRIRLQRIETAKAEHARHRFEFRQARLAREEAEKQARREARRQAAQRAPVRDSSMEAATSAGGNQADIRSLRIAQSAAKAAVRKAEKVLARSAEQDPQQDLSDLETQLATARENLEAAEARLAAARGHADTDHKGAQ